MRKTLAALKPDLDVETLQQLLQQLKYGSGLQVTGLFDAPTLAATQLFQLQHVGPNRLPLTSDGVVGPATWWALENPSGAAQRSNFPLVVERNVLPSRLDLLNVLEAEYARNVFEVPDGSNRSPIIDGYWGRTGLLGKAWCCTFVSEMLHRALGRYPFGRHHTGVQKMFTEALAMGRRGEPVPGNVFIQIKEGGQGHTGFVSATSVDGWVATFEGNCGNRHKHGRRLLSTIDGFIDPFYDGQEPVFTPAVSKLSDLGAGATR